MFVRHPDPRLVELAVAGQQDLFTFGRGVLGYDLFQEEVQGLMAADLMGQRPNEFSLFLWPRNTYKSTMAAISFPLWKMCRTSWTLDGQQVRLPEDRLPRERHPTYGDIRILLLGYTKDKAANYLSEVKAHLSNPNSMMRYLYRDRFGGFLYDDRPKSWKWNAQEIEIATRIQQRKEPTMTVGGVDSIPTGMHYDVIIWDDPVDPMHVDKESERRRVEKAFQDSLPLLEPGGVLAIIGTRWHQADLYGHIIKNRKKLYFQVSERAAVDKKTGKINFPTIFDREFLALQKARLGAKKYACNYLMDPSQAEDLPFKDVYWCKPEDLFEDEWVMALLTDFNDSLSERSDTTALASVACGLRSNVVFVADVRMGRWLAELSAPIVVDCVRKIRSSWLGRLSAHNVLEEEDDEGVRRVLRGQPVLFRGVCLEPFGGQKLMRIPLQHAMRQSGCHFPIRMQPHDTKTSKNMRIRSMTTRYQAGGILFNEELRGTEVMDMVLEQLTSWPRGDHDDFPDALSQISTEFGFVTEPSEIILPTVENIVFDGEEAYQKMISGVVQKSMGNCFDGLDGTPDDEEWEWDYSIFGT